VIKEYVVASGSTYSVREFVERCFAECGIIGQWEQGDSKDPLDEKFILPQTGQTLVSIDKQFYRPAEVELLKGDSSAIRTE
jgi:GDPmannose 4,6-dehydratase